MALAGPSSSGIFSQYNFSMPWRYFLFTSPLFNQSVQLKFSVDVKLNAHCKQKYLLDIFIWRRTAAFVVG